MSSKQQQLERFKQQKHKKQETKRTDAHHNGDLPSCQRLADFAKQVFDESTQGRSIIHRIVLKELQAQRKTAANGSNSSSKSTSNKKKRKKKKNKKTPADTLVASASQDTVDSATAEGGSVLSSAATVPPCLPTTLSPTLENGRFWLLQSYLARNHALSSSSTNNNDDDSYDWFWDSLLNSNDAPFFVSSDQVQHFVDAISCTACREQVRNILELDTELPLELIEQTRPRMKQEEEAFSYHAMEEGREQPSIVSSFKHLQFELVVSPQNEDVKGWQLRRKDMGPLTRDDYAEVLFSYVLGRGVPLSVLLLEDDGEKEDSSSAGDPLNDGYFDSLYQYAERVVEDMCQEFARLASELEEAVAEFATTEYHYTQSIDLRSFPIMKKVDDTCSMILERIFAICLQVTQDLLMALKVNVPFTDSDELVSHLVAIWIKCLSTVEEIMANNKDFEEDSFDLADRQGQIETAFLTSTPRSMYRELTKQKIRVVHSCIGEVEDILRSVVDLGQYDDTACRYSDLLRRVTMLSYYYQRMSGEEAECLPLDRAMKDFLAALLECSKTATGGSIGQIQEEHQMQLEHILCLLQGVLVKMDEMNVSRPAFESMFGLESMPVIAKEAVDHTEAIGVRRPELASNAIDVVRFWISLRTNPDLTGRINMPVSHMLKLQPKVWASPCHADNGKTRATCILAASLCDWMSEKCRERHAERVEQELLYLLQDENAIVQEESKPTAKTGKKGKKKKKSDQASPKDGVVEQKQNATENKESQQTVAEKKLMEVVVQPADSFDFEGDENKEAASDANSGVANDLRPLPSKNEVPVLSPATADASNVHVEGSVSSTASKPSTVPKQKNGNKGASKKSDEKHESSALVGTSNVENLASSAAAKLTTVPKQKKDGNKATNQEPNGKHKHAQTVNESAPTGQPREEGGTTENESDLTVSPESKKNGKKAGKSKSKRAAANETLPGTKSAVKVSSPTSEPQLKPIIAQEDIDAQVKIGVHDGPRFQTAEEFLVGRLLAVLSGKDK